MNQRYTSRRRPASAAAVQDLEPRRLLAGDVSALLRGSDLILRGTRADNVIVITQPQPGTLRVTGEDDTTVNGEELLDFDDVDGLAFFMHNGGRDSISILGPIDLPEDLRARLGNDEFLIDGTDGRVRIGSDANIHATSGSNVTLLNDVVIGDDITVSTFGEAVAFSSQATLFDYTAAQFDNSTEIDNPYFPLVPGTAYDYMVEEEDDETGEITRERVHTEVLSETRTIAGVQVRVVRDREFEIDEDGEELLIEDTFDFYAQDNDGNVWYFGEDTTSFEYDDEGNLIGTSKDGSFEVGVDGARAGIIMLADPTVGDRYYQEFFPGEAIDYGDVLATDASFEVPVGQFGDVLQTEDVNPLEPFELENKFYAPGLGLIGENALDIEDNEVIGTVRLTSVTLNGQPVTQVVSPDGFEGTNPSQGTTTGPVEFNDRALIAAGGEVLVKGADADNLHIDSDSEALVIESTLGGESSIHAEGDVSLKEVTAFNPLEVRGSLDLFVFKSDLTTLKVRLGGGDDELIIQDSMIEMLDADGGAGEDEFEELGENEIDFRRLRRFETA